MQTPAEALPPRARSRITLLMLAVLFFAPFVSAYLAFFLFPQWQPSGRLNYGQLIDPARPVPEFGMRDASGRLVGKDPLRGQWTLLQLLPAACDEPCRRSLLLSRQLRIALGTEAGRVQRVVMADAAALLASTRAQLTAEQPGLVWLQDALAEPRAAAFFASAPANAILLLDPNGNWLMVYPPAPDDDAVQRDFKGMQKDLKKLLKLSHIG